MTPAETANVIAWCALGIAVTAAGFSGWQAWIAHQARRAANDRAMVEWEPADWTAPEVVEIRSKGPDEAREVWVRLTANGIEYVQRARRLRPGQPLRFTIPDLAVIWDEAARRAPREDAGRENEDWAWSTMFGYGALITWKSRYGRPDKQHLTGIVRRKTRVEPMTPPGPWPSIRPEPDPWNKPGMPI